MSLQKFVCDLLLQLSFSSIVKSSNETYDQIFTCNNSIMGASSEAGYAYRFGAHEITPSFRPLNDPLVTHIPIFNNRQKCKFITYTKINFCMSERNCQMFKMLLGKMSTINSINSAMFM